MIKTTVYSTEEILDNSGISIAPPKRSRSITTATTMPPRATVTSSRAHRSDAKPVTKQEATGEDEKDNDDSGDNHDDEEDEDEENDHDDEEDEDEENEENDHEDKENKDKDDEDEGNEDEDNDDKDNEDEDDKDVPEDEDDAAIINPRANETGKRLVM